MIHERYQMYANIKCDSYLTGSRYFPYDKRRLVLWKDDCLIENVNHTHSIALKTSMQSIVHDPYSIISNKETYGVEIL